MDYNIKTVEIDSLKESEWNYNKHPEKQLDELKRSLDNFGQTKPIVVWNNQIIAGNGVYFACKELGWSEILISDVSDKLTEEQAKRYLIADNATAFYAEPDLELLNELFTDIGDYKVPGVDDEWLMHFTPYGDPYNNTDDEDDMNEFDSEDDGADVHDILVQYNLSIKPEQEEHISYILEKTGKKEQKDQVQKLLEWVKEYVPGFEDMVLDVSEIIKKYEKE